MAPDVHRLLIGHMGCYAALPGLGVAADFARARGRPAVLLCLELPSLHVQPAAPGRADLTQVVAHALFGDAAAAAVVTPDGPGFEVADLIAVTDTTASAYMTWDVTDHGFRMGLSPRVPGVLARHVHGVVTGLLGRHGLEHGLHRRLGGPPWRATHPGCCRRPARPAGRRARHLPRGAPRLRQLLLGHRAAAAREAAAGTGTRRGCGDAGIRAGADAAGGTAARARISGGRRGSWLVWRSGSARRSAQADRTSGAVPCGRRRRGCDRMAAWSAWTSSCGSSRRSTG